MVMSQSTKRQLSYSLLSLVAAPFLMFSITSADPIVSVAENGQLPFDTLLFIGLGEFLKVFWVLWLFPIQKVIDLSTETGEEDLKQKGTRLRLPISRKDTAPGHRAMRNKLIVKITDTFWGIGGFSCSVLICHVMLVLFGAPFLHNWTLTLQLSFILVCWLFFPLCLVLPPGTILSELFYISLWDYDEFGLLSVAKRRFLGTCFGAWIGAIVVPLDWDRPWQQWPIPCLASATASQLLINLGMVLYFVPKPSWLTWHQGQNKVKGM